MDDEKGAVKEDEDDQVDLSLLSGNIPILKSICPFSLFLSSFK